MEWQVRFVHARFPTGCMASGSRRSKRCASLTWHLVGCTRFPASLRLFYRGGAREEMLRATAAGAIALNPLWGFHALGRQYAAVRGVLAFGAFQLVDDRPGVREWFRNGEHLVIYRDRDHLRELVRYYLAHDDERRQIADAGRAHALAHHTYDQRMARFVELIEDVRRGA